MYARMGFIAFTMDTLIALIIETTAISSCARFQRTTPLVYLIERPAAMQEVAKALKPETWRGEAYGAVRDDRHSEPWFRIDRSASTFFGISQFGCHLNGYVRDLSHHNTTSVWLGVRSSTKAIHPGKLDTLVGGGLPWDISPLENMLKEAEEEAGLTLDDLGRAIRSTGALTYRNDERQGFKHNTMVLVHDFT
ncbi:hypothetical protein DYB32_004220 [Aphanomyces invadans]|uniref:DUF4743 domain-containing protein n=1 Tax=Aphanomyces invadans TaxID=157072 RepID=A0A3R6YZV0_9STRA|nr:hypothetical protein DYB32_004220 [Aphanomyces invadans]